MELTPIQTIVAAVFGIVLLIFFIQYLLPIFGIVLIALIGLVVGLFLLDAVRGGSTIQQLVDRIVRWLERR